MTQERVPILLVGAGAAGLTLHFPNHALSGLVVCAAFAASTCGQLLLERFPQHLALPVGCIGLIIGLILVAGDCKRARWYCSWPEQWSLASGRV